MDIQGTIITDVIKTVTVYSPKGRYAEIKKRDSYGLSLCIDGRITYTHKGVECVEDRAHAVLLPMGEDYSIRGDEEGSFPVINFLTLAPLCSTVVSLEVRNPDYLIKCYEEIRRLREANGSRTKIMSIFYEMLDELSPTADTDIISPALKFLYEHYYLSDITNKRLAAKCNISEVYFRRLFKERMGISPKQYILELRLRRAMALLTEGKQKICAIAADCGFESDAHFCRCFKKHSGLTPSEYRKKNQIYGI